MKNMLKLLRGIPKKSLKILINKKIETIFLYSAFVLVFILLCTQIGLMSNSLRAYLSDVEVFEGHYIKEVDSLIKAGTITLELVDLSKEHDVKVLTNGVEAAAFDKKSIDINVKDNTIIEIDGSRLKSPATVRIVSKSSNIIGDLKGTEITVNSNIKILTRIKIK